jgi:transcriptional regulator with XRE-family HTH domain
MMAMSNMPQSWTVSDADAREANFRRGELGALMRAKRRQLGGSRERLAEAAEVSVDLYARLERGRSIPVSTAALSRIAVALHLDPDETRYIRNLARPQIHGAAAHEPDRPCDVAQLLDGFRAGPAYVVNARWDLLGWNDLFEAMNPEFAAAARAGSPNLLRAIFVEPSERLRQRDWGRTARRATAMFRMDASSAADDAGFAALTLELTAISRDFAAYWSEREVRSSSAATENEVRHPATGWVRYRATNLAAADGSSTIVLHLPDPHDGSAEKVAWLRAAERPVRHKSP